jgi:hypothetical protein
VRQVGVLTAGLLLTALLCVAQGGMSGDEQQSSPARLSSLSEPSQATPQKPPEQSGSPGNAPSGADEKQIEKQEQSYRVMGVVPMFGTTNRQNALAMTPGEKFKLFVRSAFDPVNFAVIGVQAGISQASNSFPAYGQGVAGYGKRYGAAFTDSVSAGFFSNFFYPTLLKQDPRYFRLGEGTIKHRIWYSMKQEFVAHTDSGGRAFHFSNVLGALTAGGISNAYYPEADRGFELTLSRSGIALLYGTVGGVFSEFWPEIQRKILHKNKPDMAGAFNPAAPRIGDQR